MASAIPRNLAPAVGVLVLAAMTTSGVQAADCDRACLKSMITQYVDAMVAHDPSRLPLAADVRFTEDSKDLKLGEGLWKTVTRKGDFRQDYIDLKKQIAAAHVMLFEENAQVLYSVVLRVAESEDHRDRDAGGSHHADFALQAGFAGQAAARDERAGARRQADAARGDDPRSAAAIPRDCASAVSWTPKHRSPQRPTASRTAPSSPA